MSPYSPFASVYSLLLDFCGPPPRFPDPWGFLPAPPDCYGPVGLPDRALAALAAKHPLPYLIRSGVVGGGPNGPRLAPRLTRAGATIIPHRMTPAGPPFALLVGRGCLPARRDPIWAARRDAWTTERVARGGLLFLAASIADVALLRALGMPATLAGGLRRLTLSGLGHLQGAFPGPGLDDPLAPRADEFDGLDPDDGPESRLTGGPPSLVIVGWSPRALSDRPSPTLGHAARHLDAARRYLSYRFGGVSVWKPSPQEIDSFRYRFRFRSAPQVALAFRNSADNMYDLAVLAAGPPAPPPVFATAQAALVDALAAAGTRSLEDLGSRAQADYDAAVRRVLVKPLLSAASRGLNPIGRASIVQLALTADLLFGMAPHVKTLLVRALTDARGGGEAPFPDKILYQFSRLSDQFRALTNQVQRLQGPDL